MIHSRLERKLKLTPSPHSGLALPATIAMNSQFLRTSSPADQEVLAQSRMPLDRYLSMAVKQRQRIPSGSIEASASFHAAKLQISGR
jgi:hypothetical protein